MLAFRLSTVFDLGLSSGALDLVRWLGLRVYSRQQGHHRSHSRLKPNQRWSQAWFLWSHVPMDCHCACTRVTLSVNVTPQTVCPRPLFLKKEITTVIFWFWGTCRLLVPQGFWFSSRGLHRGTWEGLGSEKPQHEPLAFMLALGYVKRHDWELLLSHY